MNRSHFADPPCAPRVLFLASALALCSLAGRSMPSCAAGLLDAPLRAYVTGSGPYRIAVGDLNGDAWPDVVAPGYDDTTISILLGQPGGTLGVRTVRAAATGPYSVTIGRVDDDVFPDVVVTNKADVSVFLNLGNGSLGSRLDVSLGAGASPSGAVIADVDGDGHRDLIVADNGAPQVLILRGNGAGGFAAPQAIATGAASGATSIARACMPVRLSTRAASVRRRSA